LGMSPNERVDPAFVGTRWGTEPAFLSRLATLTRLGVLRLPMSFTQRGRLHIDEDFYEYQRYQPSPSTFNSEDVDLTECRQRVLMLTQEYGLDQLQTLRRLRRLEGTFTRRAIWRKEEAQFVLKNWLLLESLEGFVLDRAAAEGLKRRANVSKCEVVDVSLVGEPLFQNW